jgi:hypothetical protein
MPPEPSSRRDTILEAVERERALLSRLGREQEASRTRLVALRSELASLESEPEIRIHLRFRASPSILRTPGDKVKLFRLLFRGLEEICWFRTYVNLAQSLSAAGRTPRIRLGRCMPHGARMNPAFEWLERADTRRDSGLSTMRISLFLRSLLTDPGWKEFMRKMGFEVRRRGLSKPAPL